MDQRNAMKANLIVLLIIFICSTFICCSSKDDLESRDELGYTKMHIAVIDNDINMINMLISKGADVNAKSYDKGSSNYCSKCGPTPLHIASVMNNVKAANILIQNGANVDSRDKDGMTPLHMAVAKKKIDVAKLLLDNGADVNQNDNFLNRTPLYWATDLIMAKLLLAKGAKVDVTDKRGITPSNFSDFSGHKDVANLLRMNKNK